ncbi:hypothetical protein L208DRAFT_1380028 [Tricholoma matsutake]|nr:hypothetical protein L208DRAFT_1380028 [Tricholoma matsutake 945]
MLILCCLLVCPLFFLLFHHLTILLFNFDLLFLTHVLLVSSAASGIESFLAKSWGDNPCSSVKDTEELEYVWDSLVDVMWEEEWQGNMVEGWGTQRITGVAQLAEFHFMPALEELIVIVRMDLGEVKSHITQGKA